MLNRNERGHKESENFNSLHFKTVHYRVYKCTVILHVPMGRAHRESSMSKLDYDAKRVANIYIWNYPTTLLILLQPLPSDYCSPSPHITAAPPLTVVQPSPSNYYSPSPSVYCSPPLTVLQPLPHSTAALPSQYYSPSPHSTAAPPPILYIYTQVS